jgi:CubicO group peptidase (beta-lactamase class C family)
MKKDQDGINITRRNFLSGTAITLTNLSLFGSSTIPQEKKAPEGKTTDYSSVIDRIRKALPGLMTQNNIPGLAIGLVDAETLVCAEGFGYTDQSRQIKVTDETLFSLQSISKTYTAVGCLIALEKGRLKLDDRLKKYLPRFTINSRFGAGEVEKITIRHLLSHRAGLPHEAPCGNNHDEGCSFEHHIKSISNTWLLAPVGRRFSYSNLGIDLAGYVLQLISRTSFEQVIKDEMFRPLGMASSTFNQREALENGSVARGHIGVNEVPRMAIPMIPAGGMYSSVRDMARFISFQLSGGKVNGKSLISEKLLKEMAAPQFAVEGQIGGYGLGIYNVASFGATKLLHSGGGYGYSVDQRWIPEYGVGAVVLTNQRVSSPSGSIANRALELMIESKLGSVPKNKPIVYAKKPAISIDAKLLRRLEGTYKNSGNTFRVEEGSLYRISDKEKFKLDALNPTEFTSGSQKYTFSLDASGKAQGVEVLDPNYSNNGLEYWPVNDSPHDEPGANRSEWRAYVGEYATKSYDGVLKTQVAIKNGYLYLSWNGGLKLGEYKPGLFFTAEGEAVIFQQNKMLLGNRPFLKES